MPFPRRIPTGAALLAALLITAPPVAAGPWIRAPGDGYIKLGVSIFSAEEGYEQGLPSGLEYRATSLDLYGEVGLPFRTQLTLGAPWISATNHSVREIDYTTRSPGDLRLAVDRELVAALPLAIGVEATVPTSVRPDQFDRPSEIDAPLYPDFLPNFPTVADGVWEVTPRVQVGRAFRSTSGWGSVEMGYRWRETGWSHAWHGAFNGGVFVFEGRAAVGLFGDLSISTPWGGGESGAPAPERAWLQPYLLVQPLDRLPHSGLALHVGQAIWRRHTEGGTAFGASLYHEF